MIKVTVDELIQDTLAYDNTPTIQDTFGEFEIAGFLDTEMRNTVTPLIIKCMEEFFVVPYATSVGPNVNRVKIPGDGMGFRVRDVYLYPSNSQQAIKANRLNPDQLPYLVGTSGMYNGWWNGRGPTYYIENNELIFYPALSQEYTAVVRYFKAPNHLYPYLTCTTQVISKGAETNILFISNLPTGTIEDSTESPWLTYTGINATTIDVIKPEPPFNFRRSTTSGLPMVQRSILAIDTDQLWIQVDQETFDSVEAGDYLATTGTFGFVQYLPFEAYNLLCLRASMRILKAQGDLQNLEISARMYAAAADDLANLITPKVENAPQKVANYTNPIGRAGWSGNWSR